MPSNKLILKEKYEEKKFHERFYSGGPVVWSQSGEYLCCVCDGVGIVLSVDTGQKVRSFSHEEDAVIHMTLSPDNSVAVTYHKSSLLRQWNFTDGELVRTWKCLHEGSIVRLVFDSTSTLLATGGSDSAIKVWDIDKQYCTHNLRGCPGVFSVVVFHPVTSKALLFGAADDCVIRGWDLLRSTIRVQLKGHFSTVTQLQFTSDGNSLVSCGRDKVVLIWDIISGTVTRTIPVFEPVEGLLLLPASQTFGEIGVKDDCLHFITAGETGILRVFNATNGNEVFTHKTGKRINQLNLIPRLEAVATVSEDDSITLRKLQDLRVLRQWIGNHGEILDLCLLGKDESYLAVANNSNAICVYHLSTLSCQLVDGHTDMVLSLAVWNSNPARFVSTSKDNSIRVWSIDDVGVVKCVTSLSGHTANVTSVATSEKDATFLVSASEDTTLKLWTNSEDAFSCECTVISHDSVINSVCVSPNDKIIATGSQDHTAKLWSRNGLRMLGVLRGHRRGVWCVRFSPEDQVLASTSADCTVRLWSISDFTCLKTFEGHSSSVLRVSFLSRGSQLLSTGSDGLIKLWTIKSSECVLTLERHTDKLWALAVSGNENEFFCGGGDSLISRWVDVTQEQQEERAQEQERVIEQQQELSNLMNSGRLSEALKVALAIKHPNTALSIVNDIINSSGKTDAIEKVVGELQEEEREMLMKYVVRWNSNSRNCYTAQVIVNSLLNSYSLEELQRLKSFRSCVEGLLPYTERHLSRISRLCQASTFLDFINKQLRITGEITDEAETDVQKVEDEQRLSSESENNQQNIILPKKRKKKKGIKLLEPELPPAFNEPQDENVDDLPQVKKHKPYRSNQFKSSRKIKS